MIYGTTTGYGNIDIGAIDDGNIQILSAVCTNINSTIVNAGVNSFGNLLLHVTNNSYIDISNRSVTIRIAYIHL